MVWKYGCLAFCAGFVVLITEAVAQNPARPAPDRPAAAGGAKPPAPAQADPQFDAAKAAFEAQTESVRRDIQDALVWTGDYNAVTAGTFGRKTFEGIVAWQKRSGGEPTGILSARDRASLGAGGEAVRKAMRFTIQSDPASGSVIGVPERLLTKKSAQKGGTRWQSADGRMTLETKSFAAGETDLDALFDRATAPMGERRITYKLRKPDFIVVTGETGFGRSFIRYAGGPSGIRGFTIGYDRAMAAEAERLVIAITNSFQPFPEQSPGNASPPAATLAAPPLLERAIRPAATGLFVAPGRVLTAATALESCPGPQVGGVPAGQVKRDASGTLALLSLDPGSRSVRAPDIRKEPPASGEDLVVLGAETKGPASVAPALAGTGFIEAPLQPGAGGAPVLDKAGRIVGIVARFPNAPRLVAGVMPPSRHVTLSGASIAAFLAEAGLPASVGNHAGAATLGKAVAPIIGAIVAIECRS